MKSQQSFRITGTEHKAPKAEEVRENSRVRPHQGNAHEEIQSQAAMIPSDILLEPPDIRVGRFLRGSFSGDASSGNGAERKIVLSFNTLVARPRARRDSNS
jgi:hypothetical protein